MEVKKLWNKNYLLLLQGSWVSALGNVLYSICIGYWVYEQTQSTALMGMMSSISMFMTMVLGPICGSIVDRSNRKQMLVGMDLLRGVLMLALGFIAYMNQLKVYEVIIVAIISAICNVFFNPCATSVFADILPKDEMIRGQSIFSGGNNLISLVGQSFSGVLIIWFGVPLLIVVNGISFIISAITECFIDVRRNEKQGMEINLKSMISDMKDGLHYSIYEKGLNTLMISALVINLLGSGIFSLLLPFCYEKGFDVIRYGYLSSIFSIAGIIGVLIVSVWKIKAEKRFTIMIVSFIVAGGLQMFAYLGNDFYWIAGFFFLADILNVIANAIINATMIVAIPHDKRGVIFGFISACSTGGNALSCVIYGFLAEYIPLMYLGIAGTLLSLVPFLFMLRDEKLKEFVNDSGENNR